MTNLLKKIALGTMIGAAALTGCEYAQPRHDTNSSMYDAGMLLVAAGNVNMINAKTQKQAMHGSAAADLGRVISNRASQIDSANIIAESNRDAARTIAGGNGGNIAIQSRKTGIAYPFCDENGNRIYEEGEERVDGTFVAGEKVMFRYECPREGMLKMIIYNPDGSVLCEDTAPRYIGRGIMRPKGPPVEVYGKLQPGLYRADFFLDGKLDASSTARVITRP